MSYALRDYQAEAVDALFRYFEAAEGNPLVAMPTGSGKSLVIADFGRRVLEWGSRAIVATHVQELVEQDAEKLEALLGPGLVGVNSAGLGRRDREEPILVASVQSVYKDAEALAGRDLVIVDEAHLVGPEEASMYRRLVRAVQEQRPLAKVVGYTATPYRLKGGWLHSGKNALFTDIAHSVDVGQLVADGWLAPLVAKRAHEEVDPTGIKVVGGDYQKAGLEALLCPDAKVEAAVEEIVRRGAERRTWLVFATSVAHAEKVHAALERRGVHAACVFGDTPKGTRARVVDDLRTGLLRACVNVGVFTTGFDCPGVDLVALLRPTKSTALYVQMLGRGMRTAPGKTDCLVLDFGRNVERHGPINALTIPRGKAPEDGLGLAPAKACPQCDALIHAAMRACPDCGYEFPPPRLKHSSRAALIDPLAPTVAGKPEVVRLAVSHVAYARHAGKDGKPDSVRVEYLCGLRKIKEWLSFEHEGNGARRARNWWRARAGTFAPDTVEEALARAPAEVRPPRALLVEVGADKWPRVVDLLD